MWHLLFLWVTYACELTVPFYAVRVAAAVDSSLTAADFGVTFLLSLGYYLILGIPALWAILTILTGGKLGGKFNGWLIHAWVSNMTFLMVVYGAVLVFTNTPISAAYASFLIGFQIIFWILTMMFSYKAIKFGNPEW